MRLKVLLTAALFVAAAVQLVAKAPASGASTTSSWDWGYNTSGVLGNGTSVDMPLPIRGPSGPWSSITSGFGETLGIAEDGSVWAWGNNRYGQLGDGTTSNSTVPVSVDVPTGVTTFEQIDAGGYFALALDQHGHVWGWGNNRFGQLGDGTTRKRLGAVRVHFPQGTTLTAVSAGYLQSMALDSLGDVWIWGSLPRNASHVPVEVMQWPSATPRITSISTGNTFDLALSAVGKVYALGSNDFGQLGNGTRMDSGVPVRVHLPATADAETISAGPLTGYAIGADGRAWAWGLGSAGQLGTGHTNSTGIPVKVAVPNGVTFRTIAGGPVALATDGSVWAWGPGGYGTLANGSFSGVQTTPEEVHLPDGVEISSLASDGLSVFAIGTGSPATDLLIDHFGEAAQPPDPGVETLGVGNSGAVSGDVTLTYTMPPHSMFLWAHPSQGTCSHSGDQVTCDLGPVDMAASVRVHLRPLVLGTFSTSGSLSPTDATPADDAFSTQYAVTSLDKKWDYIKVSDSGFDPNRLQVRFRGHQFFGFIGDTPNGVHDASGLDLFDSGTLTPPNDFTYAYESSGTYPAADELGHSVRVKVPVSVIPSTSRPDTYYVDWGEPPSGDVADVQVAYCADPSCTPSFTDWQHGTTLGFVVFSSSDPAWQGAGTYFFRARIRKAGTQIGPDWSPAHVVTAT